MMSKGVWLICAVILAVTAHAGAQPNPNNSIGFDEFRLGMLLDQVRNIYNGSRWELAATSEQPVLEKFSGSLRIIARTSLPDSTRLAIMSLGCGTTSPTLCAHLESVRLDFSFGRLFEIGLIMDTTDTGVSGLDWCRTATEALEREHGTADYISPLFARNSMSDELKTSILHGGRHRVSNWRRFDYRDSIDQAIRVVFQTSESSAGEGTIGIGWVSIADNTYQSWPEYIEATKQDEQHKVDVIDDPNKPDKLTPDLHPFP